MSKYRKLSNNEMMTVANAATKEFKGNLHELERAIGCLIVGQKLGWKVMLLVHDKKTLLKSASNLKVRHLILLEDG